MPIEAPLAANLTAWRALLQRSALPPYTKLVCLNLSLYMEQWPAISSPSLRQQMLDTGLSAGSITRQLQIACRKGYLSWSAGIGARRTRATPNYNATFPGSFRTRHAGFIDIPPMPMPLALPVSAGSQCFAS